MTNIHTMRTKTLLLALASAISISAQTRTITLPTDNNMSPSFQDTIAADIDAWTACERIDAGGPEFSCRALAIPNAFMVELSIAVPSHGREYRLTAEGLICSHSGGWYRRGSESIYYYFFNYQVDGVPIEDWETTARISTRELVKSAAFVRTVECIARMRGGWTNERETAHR